MTSHKRYMCWQQCLGPVEYLDFGACCVGYKNSTFQLWCYAPKQLGHNKNRSCKYHQIRLFNRFFRCIADFSDCASFQSMISCIWVAVITGYVLCDTCLL